MENTPFQDQFTIGGRPIGGGAPCLFIAEAGVAHFGDMDLAVQLVELAADAGADVFKTQVFDVDQLIAAEMPEWRDCLRPRNLSLAQFKDLKPLCDERGMLFMATAHNESRIPWLEKPAGSVELWQLDYASAFAAADLVIGHFGGAAKP